MTADDVPTAGSPAVIDRRLQLEPLRRELKFMNFGRWFLLARVGEVDRGYRPGLDRNRFSDRPEAFMPGLKGVGTGRPFFDLECTGHVGTREIGVCNDAAVCVHPGM